MSVVDAHVHLYPPEINRDAAAWAVTAGEEVWARLCTRRRRDGRAVQGFPGVDELLRAMDGAGVERAVLLGWYWHTSGACRLQNRFYAACVRAHPDRLDACATVAPAAPEEARREIAWAREEGFVGLGELSPHSTGLGADDPRWHEVLCQAGELRLPVNLHVTDPASRPYPGRVDTPLDDFVRWAQRHPGTLFVLAHGGGDLPWRIPAVRACRNVFYDTAAFPLLYPAEHIGRWVEDVGADRLLWGTDWPLDLYPRDPVGPIVSRFRGEVDALPLEAGARQALLGENARRIYRPVAQDQGTGSA